MDNFLVCSFVIFIHVIKSLIFPEISLNHPFELQRIIHPLFCRYLHNTSIVQANLYHNESRQMDGYWNQYWFIASKFLFNRQSDSIAFRAKLSVNAIIVVWRFSQTWDHPKPTIAERFFVNLNLQRLSLDSIAWWWVALIFCADGRPSWNAVVWRHSLVLTDRYPPFEDSKCR